jgi:hypothetical protein
VESRLLDKRGVVRTDSDVLRAHELACNLLNHDEHNFRS